MTAGNWDEVNEREESIVTNVDSVSFYLFDLLDPYVGKANVTDETIAKIRADLEAGASYLRTANDSQSLGDNSST